MLIDIKIRLAWRILTVILKECKKMDMAKVPFSRCLLSVIELLENSMFPIYTKHPIGSIPTVCNWRQKCIPVGCVPPACCHYLPACTAPGEGGCTCPGEGVYLPGECTCPEGVPAWCNCPGTAPLWTEWLTDSCKNITFANFVWRR